MKEFEGFQGAAGRRRARLRFAAFLLGQSSWFLAGGIQMVIVQWLLVDRLHAPPGIVGRVQMLGMTPALVLLIVGGIVADRYDRRVLLFVLHIGAAFSAVLLAMQLGQGRLSIAIVVTSAMTIGTIGAFVLPARDAQLSDVVSREVGAPSDAAPAMGLAIAAVLLCQHVAQGAGALAAGSAGRLGGVEVLLFQAVIFAIGGFSVFALPKGGHADRSADRVRFDREELLSGMRIFVQSPVLRPVLLIGIFIGLLVVGLYTVTLPVMARDVYAGGAAKIGLLAAMFPIGAGGASMLIVVRGGVRRNGLVVVVSPVILCLCVGSLAFQPPFPVAVLLVGAWGMAGGFFINCSRTLVQKLAPPESLARVLAIYSLSIMGTAPLGALIAGMCAEAFGISGALAVQMGTLLVLVIAIGVFSGLRHAT